MKRIFIVLFLGFAINTFVAAIDTSYFSTLPKTEFEEENLPEEYRNERTRTGLVEPEVKTFEVSESQQKKIDSQLVGKTRSAVVLKKYNVYGELIPVNTLFYRSLLSSDEQQIYDEIYNALSSYQESVVVKYHYNMDTIIKSVCYDNPEFFWWWGVYHQSYSYSGTGTEIRFSFLFSQEKLPKAVKDFHSKSFPILFYASLLKDDTEKLKYIHDYICNTTLYNHKAVAEGTSGGLNQTAYSTIVDYNTVCAGYAKAYAYYLQQLGIPCAYIHSETHAWNLLKYKNNYYQTDVCWDDGSWGMGASSDYYLLSDGDMRKIEHHEPVNVSIPVTQKYKTHGTSDKKSYDSAKSYSYSEIKNFITDLEAPEYINFGLASSHTRKTMGKISLDCKFTDADGTEENVVYPNQRVQIHITPDRDCYVAVLMIDSKGNKTWLDTRNNFVKAHSIKTFPDKTGYELVVNGDMFGNERIIIYASTNEIGLPRKINADSFSYEDLYCIMKNLRESLSQKPAYSGMEFINYTVAKD